MTDSEHHWTFFQRLWRSHVLTFFTSSARCSGSEARGQRSEVRARGQRSEHEVVHPPGLLLGAAPQSLSGALLTLPGLKNTRSFSFSPRALNRACGGKAERRQKAGRGPEEDGGAVRRAPTLQKRRGSRRSSWNGARDGKPPCIRSSTDTMPEENTVIRPIATATRARPAAGLSWLGTQLVGDSAGWGLSWLGTQLRWGVSSSAPAVYGGSLVLLTRPVRSLRLGVRMRVRAPVVLVV
ncbi:hypothetical protein EYF80_032946 [Liparis tanakae]|uniref:Uncharacterized protein n=1 Tax=Liparis tanakae TaxID=230148 RepID=A0A4Z2GUF0_9TELE|nr:hypothetical protein EYF80_032946 [Liparis tanakae]